MLIKIFNKDFLLDFLDITGIKNMKYMEQGAKIHCYFHKLMLIASYLRMPANKDFYQ